MKGLFLIFSIAVASLVFTSCGTKHADKPAPQGDTAHLQAPVHPDTLSVISAEYIDSVYHADPKRAAKEYKGKTITVKGEIQEVHKNKSKKHRGLNWVTLHTGNKAAASHLTCTSPDVHFISELKKGQLVTIKGTCIGIISHNVQLNESEVVK
jgi:PBP1b-binding outer membrane lipoprotein LpoB